MKKLLLKLNNIWPLLLFLLLFFFLVSRIYKDFGISVYEKTSYNKGKYLSDYLLRKSEEFSKDTENKDFINPIEDNTYSGYSAFLYQINKSMDFDQMHLINFILFSILLIVSYFVFYYKTKQKYLAILAPIFILIVPRVFGQIATDNRGVPFSVFYATSVLAIYLLNHTQNKFFNDVFVKSIILGGLFGMTQSLCPLGFSIYIVFIVYFVHHFHFKYSDSTKQTRLKFILNTLKIFFITGLIATLFMVLTWPFIGINVFTNTLDVLKGFFTSDINISSYAFYVTSEKNRFISIVKFLVLTTPFIYLLLGILNLGFIKEKFKDDLYFLALSAFFIVFIASLFVKSAQSYVGNYFLVFQVLLAIISVEMALYIIFEEKVLRLKLIFLLIIATGILAPLSEMVLLHPYEYIYFNETAGGTINASKKYNIDYLQTSYKEASHWIISDTRQNSFTDFNVFFCIPEIDPNYYSEAKFKATNDPAKADYIVCPEDKYDIAPVFSVIRDGVTLNVVSKINNGRIN